MTGSTEPFPSSNGQSTVPADVRADVVMEGRGEAHDGPLLILVVDDTEANRFVVARILEQAGYHVLEAMTGSDALRLAHDRRHRPALIVLDVHLPDVLGFEVARQLKHDPTTAAIPVLHISASFVGADAKVRGLDSGADGYLTHPLEPPVLTATVRALLRGAAAEARVRAALEAAEAARAEAEAQRAVAERASRVKSEFLAVMSHELRTPLNAIQGHVQLLEMELYGPLTDRQRAALERVQRSQRHLLALINEVLNFARLETGRVEYVIGAVPLADVLLDVSAMTEGQFKAHGVAYEIVLPDPALTVRADGEKLGQILLNLLSNACKFTPAGGLVTVEVSCGDPIAHVAIRVRDNGRGIPPDKLEAVFEPFVQLDTSPTRTSSGTGLGLAISRDLARAMGGELTVVSTIGEGSTFTLVLPEGGTA